MILTTAAMCLALNIYHESRGESVLGQYAVAAVTMNRAKEPDNVCKVVLAKKQFSWTTKLVNGNTLKIVGKPKDKKAWRVAQVIAGFALYSPVTIDPTRGATHYHADYVRPKWRNAMSQTTTLGHHIFYRVG